MAPSDETPNEGAPEPMPRPDPAPQRPASTFRGRLRGWTDRARSSRVPGLLAAGLLVAAFFLARQKDVTIALLVTVDAIKNSTVGVTAGIAPTILTLGNPIPGRNVYFIAYENTPPVEGKRVLAHVNYYQLESKLYHGGPISGASENHRLDDPAQSINHGNSDDFAYPLVRADLQQALRAGAER